MTQLARNNMQLYYRVAGRTFTAKCGHKVRKGERYFVFDDYFGMTKYHESKCLACANNGEVKEQ